MVGMRDVAAIAGVSAKTVSRVFNNDPHVLDETRIRVERAMRELNYTPNVLATTFRAGRTPVIGVAVPDLVDPFFASIVQSVDGVARQNKMSTLVANLGDNPADERPLIESLLSRQLLGLLVAPVGTDHSWMERWQDHTPLVFVDRVPAGITADTFIEDDAGGAYEATEHLIGHGHTRIAYFGEHTDLSTERARLDGWRKALVDHGIDPDDELIEMNDTSVAQIRSGFARLARLGDPPSAIFSSNARSSMGLVRATHENTVPLVGFGDFPMADLLTPPLTVIDQNPSWLGRMAAERIITRLREPEQRSGETRVLDVSLIERGSCRASGSFQRLV